MEGELEDELGYEKSERVSKDDDPAMSKNYRNGYPKKTVQTQLGEVDIKVPRDRNSEYEPKIIGKYSRKMREVLRALLFSSSLLRYIFSSASRITALISSLIRCDFLHYVGHFLHIVG